MMMKMTNRRTLKETGIKKAKRNGCWRRNGKGDNFSNNDTDNNNANDTKDDSKKANDHNSYTSGKTKGEFNRKKINKEKKC